VPARAAWRVDLVWAAAAAIAAFAVYVRTLAPGLVADVDSAMFQFIGRVLGVAHNPGYPLYVLVTHPFSYIPLGTLAYRINLFSALMGAIAVALVFLVARCLECRRVVSLAAALGVAFGRIFWSQAVIAEVYTLHAAIVAGVLLALLTWEHTRRPAAYFAAVALFAAGLGNHTTIVGFAPGIALFVVLVDRPFALRARTLTVTAAILAAGLLQYVFVLVRSLRPDAYVESRATTLGELANVMLAGQFRERLFAFGWRDVLLERVPALGTLVVQELTPVGLALAGAGVLWLVRRRLADAGLLLAGCGFVFVFALNYSVIDTPVFLIPSTLVLWIAAAAGAERLVRVAGAHPAAATMSSAAVLALPLWLVIGNFTRSDRSGDVHAAVQFDRLFEALPDRSALVSEDFIVDRMVMYKLLGERAAGLRHIELVPRDPGIVRTRLAQGVAVYGSRKAARALRYGMIDVAFDPLRLVDGHLGERLAGLPRDTIVAVAVPARFAQAFAASGGASLDAIGGPSTIPPVAANVAVVGVRGASRGAVVRASPLDVDVAIGANQPIGAAGTVAVAPIEARVGAMEATIRYTGRDILRTSDGVAMAIWDAGGRLEQATVLRPAEGFKTPLPPASLPFYAVRGTAAEQAIDARAWTDIRTSVATGNAMLRIPGGARLVIYAGDDGPLAPRAFEWSDRARVDLVPFENGDTLRARLAQDGAAPSDIDFVGSAYRIEIDAFGSSPVSVNLAFGGVPLHAIARITSPRAAGPASAYPIDTRGLLRDHDDVSELLLMGRDEQAQLTGAGWSAVESDAAGPYRWMTAGAARLILPTRRADVRRIRLLALHAADGKHPSAIRVRLNDRDLPAQPLRPGWHAYEWSLADGTIHPGSNEATVVLDPVGVGENGRTSHQGTAVARVALIRRAP
jgi:hypothetical protein